MDQKIATYKPGGKKKKRRLYEPIDAKLAFYLDAISIEGLYIDRKFIRVEYDIVFWDMYSSKLSEDIWISTSLCQFGYFRLKRLETLNTEFNS